MQAKQIVFTAVNTAELLDKEVGTPNDNQVLVKTVYSAVSAGTERANISGVPNIQATSIGKEFPFPRTTGYSSTGIVEAVGKNVTRVQVGDRVVIHWGTHSSYQLLAENLVYKLPEDISMTDGAVTFISTFPAAALRKLHPSLGESMLIMGLGILGQFAVQLSKAAGLVPIIAVDPVKERRKFALELGADYALDPTGPDFVETVKRLTDGGAQMSIEVTGLGIGLNQALDCMRKFGRIALLGCTRDSDFSVDYYHKVHGPGITLVGAHTAARPKFESNGDVWTYDDDFHAIFKLIRGGRLNFQKMISEIHSPMEAQAVYDRLINDRNFPIGVLFDWTKLEN